MWKTIKINQLNSRVFIYANKKTIRTLPIFSQPLFEYSIDTNPEILGKAVRKCLECWSEGHPQPTKEEMKKLNNPLIQLSGEKSAKAFFSKTKLLAAKLVDKELSFYPTINTGSKKGLKAAESGPIVIDNIDLTTDHNLGLALLEGLNKSKVLS